MSPVTRCIHPTGATQMTTARVVLPRALLKVLPHGAWTQAEQVTAQTPKPQRETLKPSINSYYQEGTHRVHRVPRPQPYGLHSSPAARPTNHSTGLHTQPSGEQLLLRWTRLPVLFLCHIQNLHTSHRLSLSLFLFLYLSTKLSPRSCSLLCGWCWIIQPVAPFWC